MISDGVHPVGGYAPPPCDHVEGWRRILGSVIWERCGPDDGAVISGCSWPSVQFQLSDPDGWRVVAHNGVIGRGRGAAGGCRRRVWRNRAGAVSGRPRPRLRGVGDLARRLGPWCPPDAGNPHLPVVSPGRGRRWPSAARLAKSRRRRPPASPPSPVGGDPGSGSAADGHSRGGRNPVATAPLARALAPDPAVVSVLWGPGCLRRRAWRGSGAVSQTPSGLRVRARLWLCRRR